MYEYHASLLTVVDGDTFDATVDPGFRIHREIRLRLAGIDTHETHGVKKESEEYRRGVEEKAFVAEWFETADTGRTWAILVRTEKVGKSGRYLAEVERLSDGAVLNDDILVEYGDDVRY